MAVRVIVNKVDIFRKLFDEWAARLDARAADARATARADVRAPDLTDCEALSLNQNRSGLLYIAEL